MTLEHKLLSAYSKSIREIFWESKETLIKNVLSQLGYNLGQVYLSQGECVADDMHWEIIGVGGEPVCVYLCVNGKTVCEVCLVKKGYNYSVESKLYEGVV